MQNDKTIGIYDAKPGSSSLYNEDFYAWTKQQALLLKNGQIEKLDQHNLLEEIESMGASEVRALESRLEALLMHLLKWQHQPNLRSNSWKYTIKEQRHRINKMLKKMPSLNSHLKDIITDCYEDAVYLAIRETGLEEHTFPNPCEWDIKQILHDEYFPD